MDRVMSGGYSYDGKMKRYLFELNFQEARAIFMARYRMWPTKANFPGRWPGTACNVCGCNDTDEHVLSCPGYADIVKGKVQYQMFWDSEVLNDMEKMKEIGSVVVELLERMEQMQNIEV